MITNRLHYAAVGCRFRDLVNQPSIYVKHVYVEIAHDIHIYTILCIDMYIIVQFFIEISVCLLSYTCSLGLKGY